MAVPLHNIHNHSGLTSAISSPGLAQIARLPLAHQSGVAGQFRTGVAAMPLLGKLWPGGLTQQQGVEWAQQQAAVAVAAVAAGAAPVAKKEPAAQSSARDENSNVGHVPV